MFYFYFQSKTSALDWRLTALIVLAERKLKEIKAFWINAHMLCRIDRLLCNIIMDARMIARLHHGANFAKLCQIKVPVFRNIRFNHPYFSDLMLNKLADHIGDFNGSNEHRIFFSRTREPIN